MSSLEPSSDEAIKEHQVGVEFGLDLRDESVHLTCAIPRDLRKDPCKGEWV